MRRTVVLLAFAAGLAACGNPDHPIGDNGADTGPTCTNPCDCCPAGEVCHEDRCCQPSCDGRQCGSDGCGGSCGECGEGSVCNLESGTCCTPDCAGKSCGPDGCGGTCSGSCDPGWTCDDADGHCKCTSDDDDTYCGTMGVACGKATGNDNCGRAREVDCDRCVLPQICDPVSGTCGCTGEDDSVLCVNLSKQCGALTATDSCLVERAVECGECQPGFLCDGANQCAPCTGETDPEFCQRHAKTCGTVTAADNCRLPRTADCGTCEPGTLCDAPSNTCVPCTSETDGAFCARQNATCGSVTGVDNCNLARTANCGGCTGHDFCDATNHCHACIPDSDPAFCTAHGKQCGPLTADDNCGVSRTLAECGPCAQQLEHCDTGTCILCIPESDDDLCAYYFKNCGTPTLTDRCGQQRTPSCGSSCTGGLTCQAGVCGNGTGPTNDTCASPERLVFDATDTATVGGDLNGAVADYYGSCGGSVGKDLVYVMSLSQTTNVSWTVNAGSATAWTEVYIRSACTDTSDLYCSYGPVQGANVTVQARGLTSGEYYVIVDGYSGYSGPFTLTVKATPPRAAPANDTCATPEVLTFVGNVATATGDTRDALDDYPATCLGYTLNGGDVVYKFTLSADAAVQARVTPRGTTTFDNSVEISSSCPSAGAALACGVQTGGAATATRGILTAGDYYVLVDGTTSYGGPFTLELTKSAPIPNDLCNGAADVALTAAVGSTDLLGSIQGDTVNATDDYANACQTSGTGKDLVYRFAIPPGQGKNVRIDVAPQAGSALQPLVALRTACAPFGVEKNCTSATTGTASLSFNRLPAGIYAVIVDGMTPTANGPFTLSITASEPPPAPSNDQCPRAMALSLTHGRTHLTGSTAAAGDEYGGGCATSGLAMNGSDLVYTITTSAAGTLIAAVQANLATSPGFRPAVYIESTCGDPASDRGCALGGLNGYAKATALNVPAGTYFIIVDGVTSSFGDFDLDVVFSAGAAPDTCAAAKQLVFDQNGDAFEVGDSCTLASNASNVVGNNCAATNTGADAVYRVDFAAAKTLTVSFNAGQSATSYVYVRSTCSDSASQTLCHQALSGAANTLPAKNLAAGTYYIWLDNDVPANCGLYDVAFHLADPAPVPGNDLCGGAQAIAIDTTSGVGTATGTTDSAMNDGSGTCASGNNGPEVYFSFTLSTTKSVDIQVTPSAGSDIQPVVYLQSTCGTASSENGCAVAPAPGLGAAVQYPRMGMGTYYVVVESNVANVTGAFTVTVTISAPGQAAANDLCANATAMPAIDPVTKKTTIAGNTLDGNDDAASYCASSTAVYSGGDLVYSFVLPSDALVTAKVTRTTGNVYKPAVSIRSNCAPTGEAACANDSPTAPTGIATVTTALTAGTWHVFVDGIAGSFGQFTLEVTQGAAALAGDTCGTAQLLTFTGNTATYSGNLLTTGMVNDYGPTTCSTTQANSADMVFAFTTRNDAFITVTMAPQASGGANLMPFTWLRSACGDKTSELACAFNTNPGGTSTFTTVRMPPGTYYLFADAYSATYSGAYTLTVTTVDAVNLPPNNDTCGGATPIVLTNNEAHLTGDTRDAFDDYGSTGTCGANGTNVGRLLGGDVVYSVTVVQGSTVTASVVRDATTTSYVPAVYLRSTCTSAATADQLACDFSQGATYPLAAVTATNLAAGTYYLVVDGKGGTTGRFTLDVYVRPTPIANTSCAAAEPLVFDTSTPGVAVANIVSDTLLGTASTAGVQQGLQSCTGAGRELYYSFTTSAVKDVVMLTTPLNSTYAPVAYLRTNCGDAYSQVACNYGMAGKVVNLTRLRLPAGAYTLVVDSSSASANGAFSAQLKVSDPPTPASNDTCAGATALTLPASGGTPLTISATTLTANNDYVGGCQTLNYTFDGPDLVYGITPTTNTQVTAKVVARSTSVLKAAVYLRSTCATVSDDVCRFSTVAGSSTGATVYASLKAGRTYYLFVDGLGGTAGDFDLTVSVDDTKYLEGDQCMTALSLDSLLAPNPGNPGELVATLSGDTTLYSGDYEASCGSGSGGEIVYSLTLSRESLVTITGGPASTSSSYRAQFYLATSCGEASTTQAYCVYTTTAQQPKTATLNRVPAGTYYLFVDTYVYNAPYTYSVSVKDPPTPVVANDSCSGATLLSFTAGTGNSQVATVVAEDSSWASNDAYGTCFASTGADLVYKFTTNGARSFKAVVAPDMGQSMFKPVVYLRNVCNQSADSAELGCVAQSTGGSMATLTINSVPAGSYYLYVDNSLASPWEQPGGRYSVTVTLDDVATPAPPANDSCAGAQAITLTGQAPSLTTLSGQTTVGATNDTFGSGFGCNGSAGGTGLDVVYYFDLTSPAAVDAKVTFNASSAYPVVYLRQNCARGSVACNSTSWATNATASAPYLAPGRYYLWVDGYNATGSSFTIDLTLSVPTAAAPPTNYLCSGTLPALTSGVAVTGSTIGSQNTNGYVNGACAITSAAGPNVIYTYTPTATGFFTVTMVTTTLSPGSNNLMVWMSDKCLEGPSCLILDNSGMGVGTTNFFRYWGKANTTYYIAVDSVNATSTGTFTLKVN